MILRLYWTSHAFSQLGSIVEYIALDNHRVAVRILVKIEQCAEQLVIHPFIGRLGRVAGTRELVIPGLPYILAYAIRGDSVQILSVVHHSQRWPEVF